MQWRLYGRGSKVAMIDEFQDTDPVQWKIFKTIFNGWTSAQSHHIR